MRMDKPKRPPVYREDMIKEAETLDEIAPHLCYKSGGDETKCVGCPDRLCTVGIKTREILNRMTAPVLTQEDPDLKVYKRLLSSSTKTPVYELVKTAHRDLSFHPKRFSRKDAMQWLESMRAKYPEARTERTLEEALQEERRKDYERYLMSIAPEGIGEKRGIQIIANAYGFRYNEAAAYVNEIKREFGSGNKPEKRAKKKEPKDTEEITSESIQRKYEEALNETELVDEQYLERLDEIDEEIRKIDEAIQQYEEMIAKIKATEKELEFTKTIVPIEKRDEQEDENMPVIEEEDDYE